MISLLGELSWFQYSWTELYSENIETKEYITSFNHIFYYIKLYNSFWEEFKLDQFYLGQVLFLFLTETACSTLFV